MLRASNDSKIWREIDKDYAYVDECYNRIRSTKDSKEANEEIIKLYEYIKQVTPKYFNGKRLHQAYKILKYRLLECEQIMPKGYIFDPTADFYYGMYSDKIPNNSSENILNWLVYTTRKYLMLNTSFIERRTVNFNSMELGNQCEKASRKIEELCIANKIPCKKVIIHPGFCEYPELYNGDGYHWICIVTLNGVDYGIDCTYRQFFALACNNVERLGIIDVSGCRLGIFMLMNEERKKLASDIIRQGWFQLTKENLKNYFDGFAISYRNGLYYQVTNDYSYTTNYQAEDYMRFINGLDNQFNYENEELLGYQRTLKPIKYYEN